MKNNKKYINNNLKISRESSRAEISSNNKINIYKNNFSDELDLNNINKINAEKDYVNKVENNQKLILSKNKSKKNATTNINNQIKFPANKKALEGKAIFNHNISQYTSVFLKNLKIKKINYKEKNSQLGENALSSNRAFNLSENENNEYIKDMGAYNYENGEDYQTYRTEEDFLEDVNEDVKKIPEELFNKIISNNLDIKINNEELKLFFFNPIPKDETFVSNININYPEKNGNNDFNYNLEILSNNKIYFFAKIVKYFPQMNIKIFCCDNYNNINNEHFSQISSFENENKRYNSELVYVGKIISNMMRTNFIVYSGKKKILDINYAVNIFGLLGLREMKVNKYINNNISFSLSNSKPEWDFQYNNYKMAFNGRVKQTSKKNFTLKKCTNKNELNKNKITDEDSENSNIIQSGKIDDKAYTLDFISPLSPFEAFCISITSLITKISCE